MKFVGKKFLMKNGRMGKVMRRFQYSFEEPRYSIRAVGRTKLRNLHSYSVTRKFLERMVIMWFKEDEIKVMYKKIEHYDKSGKVCSASDGVKWKRVKKYY